MNVKKKPANKTANKNRIIHSPRLDSIIMVEETCRHMKYCPTKNQLWRALPKSMMWQTFGLILEYLAKSRKIDFYSDGRISWVFIEIQKPSSYVHDISRHAYIG